MNNYLSVNNVENLLLKTGDEDQSGCIEWNGRNVALCTMTFGGLGGCGMPLLPYAFTFFGVQLPSWVLGTYGVGIGCINCMGAGYLCCSSDDKKDKEQFNAFKEYEKQTEENLALREKLEKTENKLLILENDRKEADAELELLNNRFIGLQQRFIENETTEQNPVTQTSYFGAIISKIW